MSFTFGILSLDLCIDAYQAIHSHSHFYWAIAFATPIAAVGLFQAIQRKRLEDGE